MMPEWISVKDRLPEELKPVITYSKNNGYQIAMYTSISWYFSKLCEDPTHWMPLPEAPKTDGGKD